MAADPRSPLDHALDLVVFAPVGLALTAKDELPGLIEKGRQRLGSQVMVARMVGQFAAAHGQRVAGRLVDQMTAAAGRIGGLPPTPPLRTNSGASSARASTNGVGSNGNGRGVSSDDDASSGAAARPAATARGSAVPASAGDKHTSGAKSGAGASGSGGSGGSGSGGAPIGTAPTVDTLAIPGYDSLAASQVVQRLAGLSAPELEAVRRYELATRGRRTILSKVAQLQTERSASHPASRP